MLTRATRVSLLVPRTLMSVGSSVRYKVYTKTGDGGSTSLYSGERRKKDDAFFHALGDVDELNAAVGLSREHCAPLGAGLETQLVEIQSRLLDAGSAIATPASSSRPEQLARAAFDGAITAHLEAWIDAMEEALPPLKNFILPVRLTHYHRV
jgi:cob(I)alamin adenosyltransferase